MGQIVENLLALGRGRLIGLAAVGIAIVVALLIGVSTVMAPSYRPLYAELTPASAAKIVAALEQAGFAARISPDGAVISVPEEDLARARMVVAETGLDQEGAPGWELFDQGSGLGMNSFLQKVTRLRALEGELARSIRTIDGVDAARVHLVLPEREAFSHDAPEPTASVVVRFRPGQQMSRREAVAVRNLVAAAVPGLHAERVTVLSTTGAVILAESLDDALDPGMQTARAQIEERMARNIESILNARVGAGNARVTVTVDLSTERKVIYDESYDPDQQVALKKSTREEQSEGRESGDKPVGVENNIPAALQQNAPDQSGSSEASTVTEEQVDFAIGKRRSETVIEPGEVEQVSVAVLVNGIYEPDSNGVLQYRERTPEELERLQGLVRGAVGYSDARGDTLSIDSMQFADYAAMLGEAQAGGFGAAVSGSIPLAMRLMFALAVVGVVMLAGVRPALARLAGDNPAAVAAAQAPALASAPATAAAGSQFPVAAEASGGAALPALAGVTEPVAEHGQPAEPRPRDYVRLSRVDGAVLRQQLEAVGNLVEQEPDASLSVLRGWLKQAM